MKTIYMDNHSTTKVDERVLKVMLPYFCEDYGNSSAVSHDFGLKAKDAVEKARGQVADIIGAGCDEIFFTATATEANNFALKGAALANKDRGNHIITSMAEHRAVLNSCHALEKQGFQITYLKPQKDGRILPEQVEAAINDKTILASLMIANNENGVVHDVEAFGKILSERKIIFHTDAVQGIGKVPFDVNACSADLVSLSAHKMYGPKGVAALYVRKGIKLEIQIDGGGQENGLRSGTHNVPGIVGFGECCRIAQEEMPRERERILRLRESLRKKIMELPEVFINGSLEHRLPGNLNVSFPEIESNVLLGALKEVAISSGSACSSGKKGVPSHVLLAQGVPEDLALGSIRFGIGRFNTQEEVDLVGDLVVKKVRFLSELSNF